MSGGGGLCRSEFLNDQEYDYVEGQEDDLDPNGRIENDYEDQQVGEGFEDGEQFEDGISGEDRSSRRQNNIEEDISGEEDVPTSSWSKAVVSFRFTGSLNELASRSSTVASQAKNGSTAKKSNSTFLTAEAVPNIFNDKCCTKPDKNVNSKTGSGADAKSQKYLVKGIKFTQWKSSFPCSIAVSVAGIPGAGPTQYTHTGVPSNLMVLPGQSETKQSVIALESRHQENVPFLNNFPKWLDKLDEGIIKLDKGVSLILVEHPIAIMINQAFIQTENKNMEEKVKGYFLISTKTINEAKKMLDDQLKNDLPICNLTDFGLIYSRAFASAKTNLGVGNDWLDKEEIFNIASGDAARQAIVNKVNDLYITAEIEYRKV